jgi:histidinol-phosphatase (PHP family)
MKFCNYHTHTRFCDGANTAEEMVVAALELGCPELGFSGHSYLPFDPDWTMSPAQTEAYRKEVLRLRDVYRDRISVRLGLELDTCSAPVNPSDYDYLIGAVHCIFKDGHYISVDYGAKELKKAIQDFYDGDIYAFAEDYYREEALVYEKTACTIVAHFDLVTKFMEAGLPLDCAHPRYRAAADAALDALLKAPVLFEINTGAMSRGYRTTPYPDEFTLSRIAEKGGRVILSSDSHAADTLLFGFEDAMQLVKKHHLNLVSRLD